jgi:hypothetical protein
LAVLKQNKLWVMRRVQYFWEAFSLNRAFFAFVLDAGLYSTFQAVLLANAPPVYRFTPFLGLAAWLVRPVTASGRGQNGSR